MDLKFMDEKKTSSMKSYINNNNNNNNNNKIEQGVLFYSLFSKYVRIP